MNRPNINVTPLIDVLLVLLIIFMVVSPLKPSSFKTRVPSKPDNNHVSRTNPDTLAVVIGDDSSLSLNGITELGNSNDPTQASGETSLRFSRSGCKRKYLELVCRRPEPPIQRPHRANGVCKSPAFDRLWNRRESRGCGQARRCISDQFTDRSARLTANSGERKSIYVMILFVQMLSRSGPDARSSPDLHRY